MTHHGKFSSGRSSITTNQSTPELLDLIVSSSEETSNSSTNSTSTSISSTSTKQTDEYSYEKENLTNYDYTTGNEMQDDNFEDIITTDTGMCNTRNTITDRSTNSEESTSFARTTTSTTDTRISTTDSTGKSTDIDSDLIRKTDITSFSDNSDSAYTNSHSNFTQTVNSNSTYASKTKGSPRETLNEDCDEKETALCSTDSSNNLNLHVENLNESIKSSVNESSTQTPNTANLNVISNVQLSQTTLNVIFNQVLQDVNNKQPNSINVNSITTTLPLESDEDEEANEIGDSKIINVQPVPSFYLNRKEEIVVTSEHSRIIKYMISNVGTGSPYSKPAEIPQVIVPRFSALPRTSSMEVNTSSADSTDRESDTISLVDSLEEQISPRNHQNLSSKQQVKTQHDLGLLLPDNSDAKSVKTPQKSAVFFIPIENTEKNDCKPVSYHLPAKVKEKLSKRQQRREQKMRQTKSSYNSPKSDSNYISASDNGNQITFTVNNPESVDVKSVPLLPEINNHKTRRKSRASLPSIQNIRRIRIDSKDNIKYTECEKIRDRYKPIKRKSITKYEKVMPKNGENSKQTPWKVKIPEKLTPIYKNEYSETLPGGIYHKTEFGNINKRIEILEIVECVDEHRRHHHAHSKVGKSKIPVLIQNRLPKLDKEEIPKPVYLDFEQVQDYDPKMDQLIANILIDTLNKYENYSAPISADTKSNILKLSNEKRPIDVQISNNKYQQKFDIIPEELSMQSSLDETLNNNSPNNLLETAADMITKHVLKNNNIQEQLYKTKKTGSGNSSNDTTTKNEDFLKNQGTTKIDDVLTIPQGWITFYMLHKTQGSPDSTSDEGTKIAEKLKIHRENDGFHNDRQQKENIPDDFSKELNVRSERLDNTSDFDEFSMVRKEKGRRDTLDTIISSDAFSDNLHQQSNNDRYNTKQYSFKNVNNSNNNNNNSNNTSNNGRRFSNSEQCTTHGWSVTVSGMNTYGQLAPDVEMRLKFPGAKEISTGCCQTDKEDVDDVNKNGNSYSYPIERCQLLKRHSQRNSNESVVSVPVTEDNYRSGRLPIINQTRKLSQQIETNFTSSMIPFKFEPRQTKTSTRRYALNRSTRNLQPVNTNVSTENILNFSTETGMLLRKFPEILAVNGNGISPEQRSCNIFTSPR